eukprot:2641495-Amphidinium_carterae.2
MKYAMTQMTWSWLSLLSASSDEAPAATWKRMHMQKRHVHVRSPWLCGALWPLLADSTRAVQQR